MSTTSAAGSSKTCTAYQRSSVSAPSSLPPRITAAIDSPMSGELRAMLIVTVVAQ